MATLALALVLGWRRTETVAAATLVVVASLLLGPNVLPWYALWLLPLLVLRDEPAALLFTGTVSLAYLVYPAWQSGEPWALGWGWRALEYGPCVAVAAWPLPAPAAREPRLTAGVGFDYPCRTHGGPRTMRQPLLAPLAAAAILGATLSSAEQPVQGSFAITWDEIQSKPTGTSGMSRSVLRSPTATLDELEIHVTALPAGKTTHAPHTHANEEMIVIREGTLDAFQNGKVTRVGPGSLLFMGSNEPHNVTNVGTTTAVYHVINWASPGMKRTSSASPGDDVRAFYRDFAAGGCSARGRGLRVVLRGGRGAAAAERPAPERARGDPGVAGALSGGGGRRGTPPSIEEDELQMSGAFVIYRSTLKGAARGEGGRRPRALRDEVLRRAPAQARRRLRDRPPDVEQQPALGGRRCPSHACRGGQYGVRPDRDGADDDQGGQGPPERRVGPGLPDEGRRCGRQLPLRPAACKEVQRTEDVAAGMQDHARQRGVREERQRAIHGGDGEVERKEHEPHLRVGEMHEPEEGSGHEDRDHRSVPALDGPLQVTAEGCLLHHPGDERTHHDPQQHRDRRVQRRVDVSLVGERDESTQHALQQQHAHETEHPCQQRRSPDIRRQRGWRANERVASRLSIGAIPIRARSSASTATDTRP